MDENENRIPCAEDVEPCNTSDPDKQSKFRGTYFGLVLYPDEDLNHQKFLLYVSTRPQFSCAYIVHSEADDEVSKSHVHCLVRCKEKFTVRAFCKYFDPWIKFALVIHNPNSYLAYMLHDTPKSIDDGKTPHSITEFQGDQRLWKDLAENRNFVQFREVLSYYSSGMTYTDLFLQISETAPDSSRDRLLDYISHDKFFFVVWTNQEINEYHRRQSRG